MDNNNDLIVELMSRIIKLEKEVKELKSTALIKSKNSLLENKYNALVNFLDSKNIQHQFEITLTELKKELGLDPEMSYNKFKDSPYCRRLTRSKYFIHSTDYENICFAIHEGSEIGTFEITSRIEEKLKNCNEEYLTLLAKDIHNEMKLRSRMPSVCKVMMKLYDERYDIVDEEKGLIQSSTLKIKYNTNRFKNIGN